MGPWGMCLLRVGPPTTVPPFVRCAVYSEVWGPNYKKQGVLAPDVVGGEIVWPQFRFFPLWAA